MNSLTVHIGGVPEHFNYPWYLLLKSKELHKEQINLRWRDFDGGTGAMVHSLVNGEIDLAVMLTEGVTKAICDGAPIKLIQYFVSTPLIWGVHTHPVSGLTNRQDLINRIKNTTNPPLNVAISRHGSGSHLMAYLYAKSLGIDPNARLSFREAGDLEHALDALKHGQSDIFLWEKFTTQPYVSQFDFMRIDEYLTPWPCFVLAGREDFVINHFDSVEKIKLGINKHVAAMLERPTLVHELATRYSQEPAAIESWLSKTQWSQHPVDSATLAQVQIELLDLGLIEQIYSDKLFF